MLQSVGKPRATRIGQKKKKRHAFLFFLKMLNRWQLSAPTKKKDEESVWSSHLYQWLLQSSKLELLLDFIPKPIILEIPVTNLLIYKFAWDVLGIFFWWGEGMLHINRTDLVTGDAGSGLILHWVIWQPCFVHLDLDLFIHKNETNHHILLSLQ